MTRIALPALLLLLGLAACELHVSIPDIGIGVDGVDPAGAFVDEEEDTGDLEDTGEADETCLALAEEIEVCWEEADDDEDEVCLALEELWDDLCG